MAIYRKKPVEVRAVQFDGYNHDKIMREFNDVSNVNGVLQIETLEGVMKISPGDFVLEGTQGEVYPCKPHAFDDGYEYVREEDDDFDRQIETAAMAGHLDTLNAQVDAAEAQGTLSDL